MGIEPTYLAWKANVLPLNYTRSTLTLNLRLGPINVVEGGGFEPPKLKTADLQSALVDRLSTPPKFSRLFCDNHIRLSTE